MEELETLERFECPECPGPPPEFRLPPPPRPPFLTEGTFCPETIPDLEDCGAFPMIDPSYHTNPSLQSTALIITCAVVLLLMAAVVSVVFWKHKRKVQNILPCKSAAGAAAAAAAAAAAGRVRVLPDGQPTGGGAASPGSAVLYEDLPESGALPQLHNHLGSNRRPTPGQPTIEVRGTNHSAWQQRSKLERIPAPHHLDYLDYRDPRSILRVAEKPSRAVLGGYRTPKALLAKSQGVPLSIATHVTARSRTSTVDESRRPSRGEAEGSANDDSASSPIVRVDIDEGSREAEGARVGSRSLDEELANSRNVNDSPDAIAVRSLKLSQSRNRHDFPITPTHRSRVRAPAPVPSIELSSASRGTSASILDSRSLARRTSPDSEGYSRIDFHDEPRDNRDNRVPDDRRNRRRGRHRRERVPNYFDNGESVANVANSFRNDSIDSEGYSYIDPCYGRAPGAARRVANYGYTDEEVCPLCTMQRIQNLLERPEDTYREKRDT